MTTLRQSGRLTWIALLAVWTLLGSATEGGAQVTLKAAFVPRKETGEKTVPDPAHLSDILRVQADADSSAGIARVTFEVDEQFRAEAKAPPYTYDWDTLDENDGQHTLTVTAYNTKGQTGVQRLKVTVANQLNLGIKHFVEEGMEAFSRGDYRGLDRAARKAFKISRVDTDAIRLTALDEGIKGDPNRGFGLLDDQQNGVPKSEPFTLRVRGFLTLVRGAGNANVPAMTSDLQAGMDMFREQVMSDIKQIDAAHPATENSYAGQIARGDALFVRNHYEEAQAAYDRAAKLGADPDAVRRAQERSVMALLRADRLLEADRLSIRLIGPADRSPTCQALRGAVLFQQRRYLEAREAVREAVEAHNPVALVVAVLADLARNDRANAYVEARDAVNAADTAETQYAAEVALADTGQAAPARNAFRSAFLRSPLSLPTVVERAFEIMAYDQSDDRWIQAMNLFDLVLKYEPGNPDALEGRVAAMLHLGRYAAASPLVARMEGNDPTSPDVHIFRAVTSRGPKAEKDLQKAIETAHNADPINFKANMLPTLEEFVGALVRLRRTVPLSPTFLDIADLPAAKNSSPDEKEKDKQPKKGAVVKSAHAK